MARRRPHPSTSRVRRRLVSAGNEGAGGSLGFHVLGMRFKNFMAQGREFNEVRMGNALRRFREKVRGRDVVLQGAATDSLDGEDFA